MRQNRLRVAMYSHDTFGLGHLTRTTRIAQGILHAFPESSILILSGSPIAHRFTFPARADYIKLPAVVKAGPESYAARELLISQRRILGMRAQLILDAIDHYEPDLMLVDNVPLGMKGELLPTLEFLRRRRPTTQIHLNLRDILDDPVAIHESWKRSHTRQALEEYFDAIHVFGSATIFDAIAEYALPPAKADLLGYIHPLSVNGEALANLPTTRGEVEILVTIGGGGDGHEILKCVVALQRRLGSASPYRFHLVTGPLMAPHVRAELSREVQDLPGIVCHEYLTQLPQWMNHCDLVLSMGGYNTLCEVMARAQRSIVIPRVYPRREQELRANALAKRGIMTVIHPKELTPERLDDTLQQTMERAPLQQLENLPAMQGIARFQERIGRLLRRSARRSTHASIPRNPLLLLILFSLLGFGPAAHAALQPARVTFDVAGAYDDNVLNASDAEREAYETVDPEALFAINRMEDFLVATALEVDWRLLRIGDWKSMARLSASRIQYLHNPIRSTSSYGAKLQLRPSARSRFELELRYQPQIYGRHRRDKDAQPGAPQFRAEVHRRWDIELTYRIKATHRTSISAELTGSQKDYNSPFNERDRHRWGIAAEVTRALGRPGECGLFGEYRQARSRNEPDLGKDLSYSEWILGPWWRSTYFVPVTLSGEFAWRNYDSDLPDDWNHAGRHDLMGELQIELQRTLSPMLSGYFTYVRRWRRALLDSDVVIDYDEEGSFSEGVLTVGLHYTWEP